MDDQADPLAELRRQIDAADDAIFDLIRRRAALVASVGASKAAAPKRAIYRPAREAQIMRRLAARSADPAEAASMIRIWRALIAASYAKQGGVRVVADRAVAGVAREHFASEAIEIVPAPGPACVGVLSSNGADLAVTRLPAAGGPRSWFAMNCGIGAMKYPFYVCGRLPFYAAALDGLVEALVYSRERPGPSGDDTTLIAAPPDKAPAGATKIWRGKLRDPLSVFALQGYVKPDDPMFKVYGFVWLGAYPRPLGPSGPRPDNFAEAS